VIVDPLLVLKGVSAMGGHMSEKELSVASTCEDRPR